MKNRPQDISIEEFDYPLPDERIAKHPLAQRDACKLLVRRPDSSLVEHLFSELPGLLPPSAMLIYNNTRVINARLRFRKSSAQLPGALIEIFCLEPVAPADYAQSFASTARCSWTCFVGNSKRWKEGGLTMRLPLPGDITLTATRLSREGNASVVEFSWDNPSVTFSQIISAVGEIPIPPYLNRSTEASDSSDYQTVYSRIEGSVAAPTAGLHFTDAVFAELDRMGVRRRELTLHVGAGTFQPVKSDTIGEHPMHSEVIAVPLPLLRELQKTLRDNEAQPSQSSQSSQSRRSGDRLSSQSRRSGDRLSYQSSRANSSPVIAVGTTSVRTLESLYHAGRLILQGRWTGEVPQWAPYDAEDDASVSPSEAIAAVVRYVEERGLPAFLASTRIIIAPGYDYRIVSGMITNFHQPKSTLLLLVSAFTGGDWQPLYRYALDHDFRFLSYGDACLLL